MNKKYVFLSAILVGLGIIMAFLPAKKYDVQISPKNLLLELTDETRFVTTDEVAHFLIETDPQVQLIDVRTPEEYEKFSLPGAINIPRDSLFNPNYEGYVDQEGIKSILYSNGTIYASQAWMLYRRKAYSNIYIMEGGLNKWVETILRPIEPSATSPKEAFELYHTRMAASQYFGGGSADVVSSASSGTKPTVKRKAKKAAKGGC
ncbi:rhodanese-like domain-containing protein [Candidatus Venteria ishoeyi]|uniref:Molybdopterin biosynthesis protein MoeB n=1 Tax=Candidatus Venteria ishoeyi TaxID=1899563 RepID=A0A1H6F5Q3_9GAMM|nr:rhodanese-like domain-containing protein [Candidatus Venteria ishoeyi]SEH05432.1 molybdopterin biosynthesis protein MoeB [Candidatus Venteria ishoeyi]